MSGQFTAHAKSILLGEHSVVYGYDALCVPITSLTLTCRIEEDADGLTLDTAGYRGLFADAPRTYAGIEFLVRSLVEDPGRAEQIRLIYRSDIPMTRGLGSSAASALATIRCLDEHYGLGLSHEEIVDWGDKAEDIIHGKASGLDLHTVMSDWPIIYNKKTGFRQVHGHLGAWLVISDTGAAGSTAEAVARVRDLVRSGGRYGDNLSRLGDIAAHGQEAWAVQDAEALGTLFDEAQDYLADFGLATPIITRQVAAARRAGALGSKLSGSGLGGVVISLAASQEDARRIAGALRPMSAGVWMEEI